MDQLEIPSLDPGEQLNTAAAHFAEAVCGIYPNARIRDAIHRGPPIGRFVLIATEDIFARGILLAECDHATNAVQVTAQVFTGAPILATSLPEPFLSLATMKQDIPLYEPRDMDAAVKLGARCGHGAFAAALSLPVITAMQGFPRLIEEGVSWVNESAMIEALVRSGRPFHKVSQSDWPQHGLVQVQWLGPWSEPGNPSTWSRARRHWIAVHGDLIWDANFQMWVSKTDWAILIRAEGVMPAKATNWTKITSIEVAYEAVSQEGGAK